MDGSSSSRVGLRRERKPPDTRQKTWLDIWGEVLDINVPMLAEMRGGKGHPTQEGEMQTRQGHLGRAKWLIKRQQLMPTSGVGNAALAMGGRKHDSKGRCL